MEPGGINGSFYLHFFSVSALVPCIFMIFAGISLLAIRRRSRATLHLGVAYLFLGLFMGSYAFASSIYHPAAAYHRWVSVGALTLCAANYFLFILHYPDRRRTRGAKAAAVIFHLIAISLTAAFVAGTRGDMVFYDFEGHHYDLMSGTLNAPIAIAILFLLGIMLVTGVARAAFTKGTARGPLLAIILVTFFAILAPGAANLLSRWGRLDSGEFQYVRDTCVMAGFFIVFLVHLNTTVDRTSLMTRVMGISLATFLIVLQGLSFVSLSYMEEFYDTIRRRDLVLAVHTGQRPPGLTYLLAYSPRDCSLRVLVPPDGRPAGGNDLVHCDELFNTAMREEIMAMPAGDNPGVAGRLGKLMKKNNPYFNGYAGAIELISDRMPEAERNDPRALARRLAELNGRVGAAASMVAHLPDDGFRENLRRRLEGMNGEMAPFRDAILSSAADGSPDCALFRREALRYLAPMPPAGERHHRLLRRSMDRVTSFSFFDPRRHILYEAGFNYRFYRAHQHPTAMKFTLLTIILVVMVLGGFQLIYMGTFVRPIRRILNAIHRVREGKYDTIIPLARRDELGYISHNLNEMMSALEVSKEALSEYADNLSVMVTERTEDLARARDELWGEMQIARKMQTIMIPREPVMQGYEITGYMLPAAIMGGDYFDVINAGNADWVIIGDVAGHGVPASLVMMMAHTSIRTLLGSGGPITPTELMERVNDVITESVRQIGDDRYMTATIMAFNGSGKCTFTGLHQDIIIYRAERDAIETVRTEGIWLGIHDDARGLVSEKTITMAKDDIMFLYTDGITEAWKKGSVRNLRDPQKDMYGIERLIRVFYESRALRPEEIRDAVLESLGGYACTDDITMVILRKL